MAIVGIAGLGGCVFRAWQREDLSRREHSGMTLNVLSRLVSAVITRSRMKEENRRGRQSWISIAISACIRLPTDHRPRLMAVSHCLTVDWPWRDVGLRGPVCGERSTHGASGGIGQALSRRCRPFSAREAAGENCDTWVPRRSVRTRHPTHAMPWIFWPSAVESEDESSSSPARSMVAVARSGSPRRWVMWPPQSRGSDRCGAWKGYPCGRRLGS